MKRMTKIAVLTLVAISFVSANIYAKKKDKVPKDSESTSKVKSDDGADENGDGGSSGSLKEGMKEVGQGFKGIGKSFKGAFNSVKDGVKGAFSGDDGSEDAKKEDDDE